MDDDNILYVDSIPILPGYDSLTERMTDEEINLFVEAMKEYKAKRFIYCDCTTSKINKLLWKDIWKYLRTLDDFFVSHGIWEEQEE